MIPQNYQAQTKKIIIAFPIQNYFKIKQIKASSQQVPKIIQKEYDQIAKNYLYRLMAFIKSGTKYLTFQKAQNNKLFQKSQINVQILYHSKQIQLKRRAQIYLQKINDNFQQLKKLHQRYQDNPNRQAFLRRLVNEPDLRSNQLQQQILIYFLISDPLVKFRNNERVPIYRDEMNIVEHQKVIQQAYKTNCSIKVNVEKQYCTKQKIFDILGKDPIHKQMIIVQIFADVFMKEDQAYLCLQKYNQLGEQQLVVASTILNRDIKADLLIIIGDNVHFLQKLDIQKPMILISTYSVDEDLPVNSFINQFYSHLFKRETIDKSFYYAKTKYQNDKTIKKKKMFCCCLHQHKRDCHWNQVIAVLGLPNAHKIMHQKLTGSTKPNIQKLQRDILNTMKIKLTCASDSQICCNSQQHSKIDKKFILIQKYERHQLKKFKNNQKVLTSSLSFNGILNQQTVKRGRQLIFHQFVQTILNTKGLLQIVGDKMSGKFYFTNLACRYIQQRRPQRFHFEIINIEDNSQLSYKKNIDYFKTLNIKYQENAILIQNSSQSPHKFLQLVQQNMNQMKRSTIIFLNRGDVIQQNYILLKKLSIQQIIHLVVKQFNSGQYLNILPKIIQKFIDENDHTINQLPYMKLSKFLKNLHSKVQAKSSKVNIDQQIKHFKFGHKQLVENIKEKNLSYWRFLGLISSFRQGLLLNRITLEILKIIGIYQQNNLLQQVRVKSPQNLSFIVVEETRQKILQIFPQFALKKQWKSQINAHQVMQMQLKFFQVLIRLARQLLANQQSFKLSTQKWDQGIFMLKLKDKINEKIFDFIKKYSQKTKDFYRQIQRLIQHHCTHILNLIDVNEIQDEKFKKLQIILINTACVFPLMITKQHSLEKLKQIGQRQAKKMFYSNSTFSRVVSIQLFASIGIQPPPYKPTNEPSEKIINELNIYQSKMIIFNRNRVNKIKYDQTEENIIHQLQRLQLCLQKIDKVIRILNYSNEIYLQGVSIEKCMFMKLKILLEKVLMRFKYQQMTENIQFKNKLKAQVLFKEIKNLVNPFAKSSQSFSPTKQKQQPLKLDEIQHRKVMKKLQTEVQICLEYLDIQMNMQINQFKSYPNISQVRQNFQGILRYIYEKDDQKILLNKKNTMLYMKSRCLHLNSKPYVFSRKNQLIKQFICRIVEPYDINVGFFLLTKDNFNLIKDSKCLALFLTVDCIRIEQKNKGVEYKLLFQSTQNIVQQLISAQDMITTLKKTIIISYLIISGHNSYYFAKQLVKLYQDHPTIICIDNSLDLTFRNMMNLQQNQTNDQQSKKLNTINQLQKFQMLQTYYRLLELMIGSITKDFIAYSGSSFTSQYFKKVPQISLDSIVRIMINKWPLAQKVRKGINIKYFQNKKNSQIPQFSKGRFTNLSSKIFQIPHNLINKDSPDIYEVVGRHSEIALAIQYINQQKPHGYIQIIGPKGSGKSCLLQQLCWAFLNKKIFKQGIFRLKMNRLRQSNISIIQYLDARYDYVLSCIESEKKLPFPLLLALDDLQLEDVKQNEDFFNKILQQPISLIYTTHDLKVYQYLNSKYFNSILKIKVNDMSKIQMFNTAISRFNSLSNDHKKVQNCIRNLMNSKNCANAQRFLADLQIQVCKFESKKKQNRDDFIKLLEVSDTRVKIKDLDIKITYK